MLLELFNLNLFFSVISILYSFNILNSSIANNESRDVDGFILSCCVVANKLFASGLN